MKHFSRLVFILLIQVAISANAEIPCLDNNSCEIVATSLAMSPQEAASNCREYLKRDSPALAPSLRCQLQYQYTDDRGLKFYRYSAVTKSHIKLGELRIADESFLNYLLASTSARLSNALGNSSMFTVVKNRSGQLVRKVERNPIGGRTSTHENSSYLENDTCRVIAINETGELNVGEQYSLVDATMLMPGLMSISLAGNDLAVQPNRLALYCNLRPNNAVADLERALEGVFDVEQ